MNAYERLQNDVDEGSVRLVQAIGVPRSMSTAFCRSIHNGDAPSVYINEPFNRDTPDIDTAASHILDTLDSVAGDSESRLVIIKNMASYVDNDSLMALNEICSGTIWNIRHPLVQIGSLLTRIVNDLEIGSGEDRISQDDIYPHLDLACEFLISGSKSRNFSKTGWESIGCHFVARSNGAHVVVDGQEFTERPAEVLSNVSAVLDIPFSDRMIQGWSKGFINTVNRHNESETFRSAWTERVAHSVGVLAVSRTQLDLDKLPDSLVHHIQSTAIPTYNKMKEAHKSN